MRPQSRLWSLVESLANTAISFLVAMLVGHFLYPMFGFYPSHSQNATIVFVFLVVGMIRSYVLRRVFNNLGAERSVASVDPDAMVKVDLRTGTSTRVEPITDPTCECGCKNFYEGPSGGMATNISCADCGTWYNICAPLGIFDKLDKPKKKVS